MGENEHLPITALFHPLNRRSRLDAPTAKAVPDDSTRCRSFLMSGIEDFDSGSGIVYLHSMAMTSSSEPRGIHPGVECK